MSPTAIGRHTLAVVLVACAARAAPAAPAEVRIDVRSGEDALVIDASALMDADPAKAWSVLTDYARYARFVPGVRASRVVFRNGVRVTVEQSWDAIPGVGPWPLDVAYEIVEAPPDSVRSSAVISAVGTLESRYTLTASGPKARLEYAGRFESWNKALRPLQEAVAKRAITRQFQALVDEIERPAARSSVSRPERTWLWTFNTSLLRHANTVHLSFPRKREPSVVRRSGEIV